MYSHVEKMQLKVVKELHSRFVGRHYKTVSVALLRATSMDTATVDDVRTRYYFGRVGKYV